MTIRTVIDKEKQYQLNAIERRIESFPKKIQPFFVYLKTYERTDTTILNYAKWLDAVRTRIGKDLLKITPIEFDNFVLNRPQDIQSSTFCSWMAALREFYRYAEAEKLIDTSPISKRHKFKRVKNMVECYLQFRHADPIMKALKRREDYEQKDARTYGSAKLEKCLMMSLAIRLLLDTGCRTDELLKIRSHDITEEKVELEDGTQKWVPFCKLNNAKTTSGSWQYRRLRITSDTYDMFKAYIKLAPGRVKNGMWGLIRVKEKKTIRNWVKYLHKDLLDAGYTEIRKLAPHDFRRRYATQLHDRGFSDLTIDCFLGHIPRTQAQVYVTMSLNNVARVCGKAFGWDND